MTNKEKYYSNFLKKNTTSLIISLAFILFIISHLIPKLGLDIYLVIRWGLLLGVPIILIFEFFVTRKADR